jgi:hypothetical protein
MRRVMLMAMLPLMIAAASPGPDPGASADRKSAQDDQLMLCKTFPPPTGSRIGLRRVCLTTAEWREFERIRWVGYFPNTDHLLFNAAPMTGGGPGR